MALKEISSNKSFEGLQKVFSHESSVLKCPMKFAIYLPQEASSKKLPVIYWLSGLTCTEENFMMKAGAQQHAAAHNLILVMPDTSPRGCNAEGDDFGLGAGFYVDATQDPWKKNYNMYSYITKELPELINSEFPVDPERQSIMGHSMGGHGALICHLKNPGKYRSVSAFAPICNPTQCPWGHKFFTGFLGPNQEHWEEYDATCLVKKYNGPPIPLLIDQGTDDQFLEEQLHPNNLLKACEGVGMPYLYSKRLGYNHSYFYIATFIGEHIQHHAKYLNA